MQDFPIRDAVLTNNKNELGALVRRGMNPDERDRMGRTALMYVAKDGDTLAAEILLDAGANPNIQDVARWTALHFAAQSQQRRLAELLLDRGATIDVTNNHGNTPLWIAVYNHRDASDLTKLLVARGADADRQNDHGVSPKSLAKTARLELFPD